MNETEQEKKKKKKKNVTSGEKQKKLEKSEKTTIKRSCEGSCDVHGVNRVWTHTIHAVGVCVHENEEEDEDRAVRPWPSLYR